MVPFDLCGQMSVKDNFTCSDIFTVVFLLINTGHLEVRLYVQLIPFSLISKHLTCTAVKIGAASSSPFLTVV